MLEGKLARGERLPLVDRVSDKTRRAQLDEAYQQAEVPLIQATEAGHARRADASLAQRAPVGALKP